MAAAAGAVGMGMGILGQAGSTFSNVQATRTNAKGLELEAKSIEMQAAFDERQQRRLNKLEQGKANTIAAASGIDISSGSPLLMELDRVKQGEIEALSIRRAGAMGAASKRFAARMERRSIPWKILGGVTQSGSILSQYAAR